MPDFYVNDFQHTRENVNKATGDIILSIDQSASIEFKERVLEVARYLLTPRDRWDQNGAAVLLREVALLKLGSQEIGPIAGRRPITQGAGPVKRGKSRRWITQLRNPGPHNMI